MNETGPIWRKTIRLGSGSLEVEVGRLARQAGGAVLLRNGGTVVLVTATSAAESSAHLDFFPLTVEYREKMAGAGRIPGGFLRREARATSAEILTARVIDRSIRPFFPKSFRCETQVLVSVLSFDPEGDATLLALTGASAALTISDIPWGSPVAGVRVAQLDGELLVFPTGGQRKEAELDLMVSASAEGLVMVEGRGDEVPEDRLLEALQLAQDASRELTALQEMMREELGRPKRSFPEPAPDLAGAAAARELLAPHIESIFSGPDKASRRQAIDGVLEKIVAGLQPAEEANREQEPPPADGGLTARSRADQLAKQVMKEEIRRQTLDEKRLDGRATHEVRPLSGEVAWLPGAHGSSIFTRGETQAMVTCTLGTGQDEQLVEDLSGVRKEAFLVHYTFPPYSVGEVRPLRGPGRREIGHGALAKRALEAVLPEPNDFPFTVRIDAEITASNGSSSMATVCGGTLALLDAGVPIRAAVAGVAMGLIVDGERHVILTDILGDEDHLGDMDFKVAGTEKGITALQLDNKVGSLPASILEQALQQARDARLVILESIREILPQPRNSPPAHVPRVLLRNIRPARVRDLIGPGGRHVQSIEADTGARVEIANDGRVRIYGPPGARIQEAERRVHFLSGEPRRGGIYRGRVTTVTDFGSFVEVFRGIEGLVHISELDVERVDHPADVARVGDEMVVKVLGTTDDGKLQLSRKAALGADTSEIEV